MPDVGGPTCPGGQDSEVARQLAELGTSLHALDMTASLARIVAAAVMRIQGAEHAGISEVRGPDHDLATIAATAAVVERIDRLHSATGQGPGTDAIHDGPIVRVDDLTREQRWPLFAPAATDHGMRAMLSFRVSVRDHGWGTLTMYSGKPGAFGAPDEITGLLLASYAAAAVTNTQHQQHLAAAMNSRDIVGQAKGVLMQRHRIDGRQAFALLVRTSQGTNRRLIDIADRVARTGEDPTDAAARIPSRDQPPQAAAS